MYKAQFARWGWSKYNCKRMRRDISSGKAVEKSAGKSCHRIKRQRGSKAVKGKSSSQASRSLEDSAVLPGNTVVTIPITTTTTIPTNRKPSGPQLSISSYQIAHANDSSRFVQAILSDIRGHVYSFFHQKPDWQKSPGTSLIAAYNYAFYDSFRIALDSFLKNEHFNGGEILRQAFVEVEGAIQTDYSSTFYFFFIDLPDLFTYYGRHDILVILLQHINRLTAVSLRGKIIGAGFAGLHGLARSDPASLRHYVAAASGLWCDLLQELRGPSDRSTLLARRNHIRHARCCGDQARVRDLCDDYDRLLGEVRNRWGASHNASRHLEDVILLTQLNYGFFTDGFVGRNEKLIEEVGRKYQLASSSSSFSSPSPSIAGAGVGAGADAGTSTSVAASEDYQPVTPVSIESGSYNGVGDGKFKTLPLEAWDLLDRNIRSNCYHRLACYYAHQARIGSGGVDANQEVVSLYSRKAREGWKTNFWQLEVEVALVAAGRLFEAETLRRCRLEAQYFRKLPENDWVAACRRYPFFFLFLFLIFIYSSLVEWVSVSDHLLDLCKCMKTFNCHVLHLVY